MIKKLVGLFPYIYFMEPFELGSIRFIPIIYNEPNKWPCEEEDKHHITNLLKMFKDGRGQPIIAATCFLRNVEEGNSREISSQIHQAITILRYSLLSAPHKSFSFEQTFFYLFELPPIYEVENDVSGKSYEYKGLLNFQDDIYAHQKSVFYPPMPDLRTSIGTIGDIDFINMLISSFYGFKLGGITEYEKERVLVSIDWYNQTFQKHPIRDRRGKIVDMATAFEVLLDLPSESVRGSFRSALQTLLGGSYELSNWATSFYDIRSKIVHEGKAESLLYKHREAVNAHLDILVFARMIFHWCIKTMMGGTRGEHEEEIKDLLTSNEVHIRRVKQAGSFEKIKEKGLLEEVSKLIPAYPLGKREDIIWLGKVLLKAYKERYVSGETKNLPTLDEIISSKDDSIRLGVKYNDFYKEFEPVYFKYISFGEGDALGEELKKLKPVPMDNFEQIQLEDAIFHFARFAGFALLTPPEVWDKIHKK